MSPRRYRMAARRAAVDETRRRILDAAVHLHGHRGAVATTWDDIAAAAGVSRATVYHHFRSLDELVPACAQVAFDLIDVPTPEQAKERFAGLSSPRARLAHFVVESCRCYAAAADWLRAAWRERDLVPPLGAAVERLQRALHVLLEAALEGVELDGERALVVAVLVDFPFWDALDRAGVSRERIAERVMELVEAQLPRGGG
jgi:AcrR family transcriptional regulator